MSLSRSSEHDQANFVAHVKECGLCHSIGSDPSDGRYLCSSGANLLIRWMFALFIEEEKPPCSAID